MRVKNFKKYMLVSLALVFSLMFTALRFDAADLSGTTTYPFRTGENAFQNGAKWTAPTTGAAGDSYELFVERFDVGTVDLSHAGYLAVQFEAVKGSPGLTVGLLENRGGADDRYSTANQGASTDKKGYFIGEDGAVSTLPSTFNYGALWVPQGYKGTLLVSMDSMGWQWNNGGCDLTEVRAFYIETNAKYDYNFEVIIGEVGFYDKSPLDGGEFTKLIDLSTSKNGMFEMHGDSVLSFVGHVETDPELPESMAYPYRTGENAYFNGKKWIAPATGATGDDWQKLTVTFDQAMNISSADFLSVQMGLDGGPGLTYALLDGDGKRFSIEADSADLRNVFNTNDEGVFAGKPIRIQYKAISASFSSGQLLIPLNILGWVGEEGSLENIVALEISTNRRFNYNFTYTIGEIGFITGDIDGDEVFAKALDLSTLKNSQFVYTGSTSSDFTLVDAVVERTVYGDTLINWTATNKNAAAFGIWDGGAAGEAKMSTDSYGDTAVTLKATGVREGADAYCAITISGGAGWSWAGYKGVTFWAKNESDVEVAFNLEVDCKTATSSDRFNIKQGNRFFLYDVNTNKSSIYMTKPTATLPVGFEGWVRIPFTAFAKADWSTGTVTPAEFMAEGTTCTYLAITVDARIYSGKEFTVNKFGGYSTSPSFISSFVVPSDDRKSILDLMDLDDLNS